MVKNKWNSIDDIFRMIGPVLIEAYRGGSQKRLIYIREWFKSTFVFLFLFHARFSLFCFLFFLVQGTQISCGLRRFFGLPLLYTSPFIP